MTAPSVTPLANEMLAPHGQTVVVIGGTTGTGFPPSLSAVRVQQAQFALGGVPVVASQMHPAWHDDLRHVTVVAELGLAFA